MCVAKKIIIETHLFHTVEPAETLGTTKRRKRGVVPSGVAHLHLFRMYVQSSRPALALALIQQMLGPRLADRSGRIVLRVALHLPTGRRFETTSRARRRGHRRGEPLDEGPEHGHHSTCFARDRNDTPSLGLDRHDRSHGPGLRATSSPRANMHGVFSSSTAGTVITYVCTFRHSMLRAKSTGGSWNGYRGTHTCLACEYTLSFSLSLPLSFSVCLLIQQSGRREGGRKKKENTSLASFETRYGWTERREITRDRKRNR